jgi:hypothetical protein
MSNAVSLRTPKHRRYQAKGLALVTINGRDVYLGKYGSESSKQEYWRLVAEYLQHGAVDTTSQSEVPSRKRWRPI